MLKLLFQKTNLIWLKLSIPSMTRLVCVLNSVELETSWSTAAARNSTKWVLPIYNPVRSSTIWSAPGRSSSTTRNFWQAPRRNSPSVCVLFIWASIQTTRLCFSATRTMLWYFAPTHSRRPGSYRVPRPWWAIKRTRPLQFVPRVIAEMALGRVWSGQEAYHLCKLNFILLICTCSITTRL